MLIKSRVLNDITSKRYTVKIATTEDEVNAALKLRYNVFKEELEREFDFDKDRDKDQYDDQAHHLIVIDNENSEVIGTYRLQTYQQAESGNGFVSDKRFHLDQFPDQILKNGVEVGRACISKHHRNGRVLFLLWKGFAGYLTHFEKQFLFGYAAFGTLDHEKLNNTYAYLLKNGCIHPTYRVDARKKYQLPETPGGDDTDDVDIPPLLQNYLDVGCHICSRPSIDYDVKLSHCIILLDVETISDRTRKLFFD